MKIFLKFFAFFILILAAYFFLPLDSHAESIMYVGSQIGQSITAGSGAKKVHTINAGFSFNEPLTRVEVWYQTSGSVATDNSEIQIRRGGVTIATSTTGETFNGGSNPAPGGYNPSGSYNFNITQPLLQNGDEVWVRVINVGGGGPTYQTVSGKDLRLYSGSANTSATIEWLAPTDGQTLNGYPSHLNFNVVSDFEFCGYVTGIVGGSQGGTEGSCFPAGTTEYNYFAPGTATSGLIQANVSIADNNLNLFATSTISFISLGSGIVPTGDGIGPTYPSAINPNATSSAFFVDCSAYTVSLFSSSTLQGIGCIAKKTALDVLAILFVPNERTLQDYSALSIEDKFPFAYWYDLKSSFEGTNSSSTNAFPALSLQIFPTSSIASWSVTASFSTTTISGYLGDTMISLFRTLMQAALWLTFAYYIFRKLKAIFDHDNTVA